MANETPQTKQAQIKAELKETKVRTFGDPQQANRPAKPQKGQSQGRKPGDRNNSRPKAGSQNKNKTKGSQDRRNAGPNKKGRAGGPNPNRKRKGRPNGSSVPKSKQAAEQLEQKTVKSAARQGSEKRTGEKNNSNSRKGAKPPVQTEPLKAQTQVDQVRVEAQLVTDPAPAEQPGSAPANENMVKNEVQPDKKPQTEASSKKDRRSKSWLEMTAVELRQANEDLEEEILQSISEISQIKLY